MRSIIEAGTVWEDPLTCRQMKIGEQVTVNTRNGITCDFIVDDIQTDAIVLAPLGTKKTVSSVRSSIVLSGISDFGGQKVKVGETILLKYKNYPPKNFLLELNYDNNVLVLRDPKRPSPFLLRLLKSLIPKGSLGR